MLKFLFLIIATFAVAVGCVYVFDILQGQFILVLSTTSYEVSLKWLFLLLIVAVAVLYILYKVLSILFHIPSSLKKANKRRKQENVVDNLNNAVIAFFEGRYQKTQQLVRDLLKNKELRGQRVAALILAAESADAVNDFESRDYFLNQLDENDLINFIVPNLLLAKGALKEKDYIQFENYFEKVKWNNPKLTALAKLELQYGLEIQDYSKVLEAITQLKKNNAITDKEYQFYELNVYRSMIVKAKTSGDLNKIVKQLPSYLKSNDEIIEVIAEKDISLGVYNKAVDLALHYYPGTKNAKLLIVILSGFEYLPEKAQNKVFATVEGWLKQDPENSDLLLLLGNLAYIRKLWGKAQGYLEISTSIKPTVSGLVTLSKLYKELDREQDAELTSKRALELATNAEY